MSNKKQSPFKFLGKIIGGIYSGIQAGKANKKAEKLLIRADKKRYKAAKLYQKQKNIDKYRREGKIKAKGGMVGDSIKTYNQGGYVEGE